MSLEQSAAPTLLGAHCSASGGPHRALQEAQSIGANTLQMFTANQRQWAGRAISEEQIGCWQRARDETKIDCIMSHASYLINLGSAKPDLLEKSRRAFRAEIERCQALDITFLNFHPGTAGDQPREKCLATICQSLDLMLDLFEKGGNLTLLVENMAGQGTQVGIDCEELNYLMQKVCSSLPLGICIDTCHAFAAGFDFSSAQGRTDFFEKFDQKVGLQALRALHINDSVKGLGSRVDRHACLGKGQIGWECFEWLMLDQRTKDLPKYLETPEGPEVWRQEISHLRAQITKWRN